MFSENVSKSEGLSEADIPREVKLLALSLSRLHGDVVIRNEAHGLHLYMASPTALERDGEIEYDKRHLTVNADRYLGRGQWQNRVGTYDRDRSAVCHKYGTKFTVSDLQNFPPPAPREGKNTRRVVYNNVVDREKYLIDDGQGHRIPNHPGVVVSLMDLPTHHPAIQYLRGRGYDPARLVYQFRCGYCEQELPENSETKLFYKKLPGGFKDTPQGRLIFYVDVRGVQEGWQARILDMVEGDYKYHWHPYSKTWVPTHVRQNDDWVLLPDYQNSPYTWKPSKYRSANGMQRSAVIMGYDAAVQWNKRYFPSLPFCVIVEGPLDAARFGPPGVAFMGKYLNEGQGELIAKSFRRVIYLLDNDAAGRESEASILRALDGKVDLRKVTIPANFKDVGDMSSLAAWELISEHVPNNS